MTAALFVTALLGLGLGIWLGMPGRYTQSVEDIEDAMEAGSGRRRRAKRLFTPMAWMQRNASAKSKPSRDRRKSRSARRGGFQLESPDERE
jgi:hypothetical protein